MPTAAGQVHELVKTKDYSEGYVKVLGYWLYYRSFGDSNRKGTVLCLHGGPGGSQDGLSSMSRLTDFGFRTVMYDQLGCGKSQAPPNKLLYNVERYAEEVEGVRQTLKLGRVHLWGGSWGGFLNVAYAIRYSHNLRSLLPSSGTCSVPVCIEEFLRLRSELPKKIRGTLEKYEAMEDYLNTNYLKAVEFVYKKHLCRLDPWPPQIRSPVERRLGGGGFGPVYKLMWGENEFFPVGNLRYWDVTDQLHKIECPTLITCGEFDEVTPRNSELLHQGIKGSKMVVFKGCSHTARYEDPEHYFNAHREFLNQAA
jgi:proline-specific peptidase